MNRSKDIQAIFENYQGTLDISPQESFKRDKEFFQYVIESNPHLAPLRNVKLKYIFELYKLKLKENLDRDIPGLITENTQLNLTLRESFDIIQEFTKGVSDKSAYEGVKEIFESICSDYLIQKGNGLLVEAMAAGDKVTVQTKAGDKPATITGGAAAPGMTQVKLDQGGTTYATKTELIKPASNVIQSGIQPGATETITKDVEAVARPAGPTAQAIQQQQELRTQGAELKSLQAQQGQPNAAQIQGQQKMRQMQSQNDAMQKQIQDMEAKEAEMSATQKAQSDAQQAAMQKQMAAMAAVMQQMAGQQQQAQGAAQAAAGKPPVIGKETETETETQTEPGMFSGTGGAPPVGSLGGTVTGPTTAASSAAPKKPGLFAKAGGWLKDKAAQIAPTAGMLAGGAAGSLLGPAGTVGGAALGRALGAGAKSAIAAPKGTGIGGRLKAAAKTPVGKHLMGGAAVGGLGALAGGMGAGEEAAVAPPGEGGAGFDYSDTADVNSPEYQATMTQVADTQPALMNPDGSMGPGTEPGMDVAETETATETETETEEAPYGRNPNDGKPYPAPKGGKGAEELMKLSKR